MCDPIRCYDVKLRIISTEKGIPENYNEIFEEDMANTIQIPRPPKHSIKWPTPWIPPLSSPLPR